jgi:hypothetical protein
MAKTASGPGSVTGVPLVPGGHANVILLPLAAKRSLLPALVFAGTTNVQPLITRRKLEWSLLPALIAPPAGAPPQSPQVLLAKTQFVRVAFP